MEVGLGPCHHCFSSFLTKQNLSNPAHCILNIHLEFASYTLFMLILMQSGMNYYSVNLVLIKIVVYQMTISFWHVWSLIPVFAPG